MQIFRDDMEGCAKEPFSCIFCARGFARSDALKRHWTSCRIRKQRGLPVPTLKAKTRGRKVRACDRCWRLKKACEGGKACKECVGRGARCAYERVSKRGGDVVSVFGDAGEGVLGSYEEKGKSGGDDAVDQGERETSVGMDEEIVSTFDLDMYESAFDILDSDNKSKESALDTGDDVLQHPPDDYYALEQSSRLDLDCWSVSSSLMIEHQISKSLYQRPTHLNIHMLIQFPFLENLTNTTGFVKSFGCGTKQQRLSITLNSSSMKPCRSLISFVGRSSDPATHWVEIMRDALQQQDHDVATDALDLLPMTHKIVSQIRGIALSKSHQSLEELAWSPSIEALCFKFFHPVSIQKNLALFWSCWYPNLPAIHRPTFEAKEKSPALIAAMTLVGACLSPDERDRASAQVWFNPVEEMVFSDHVFIDHDVSSAWQASNDSHRRGTHLDMLQAAYCVCLYQTWEGCKRSKRRVLRQRFSDLVYLARDIGLAQASLQMIDTSNPAAFDWDEYILRESLIRICSYICSIDASYALFFRHTPRMVLSELTIDMCSPESCFQASSKQECFIELKTWRSRMGIVTNNSRTTTTTNLTIFSAVEALRDEHAMATPQLCAAFSHLSVLNMFTIVHALYLQVYRLETSATTSLNTAETAPIATALRQWKEVWPSATRDAELADLADKERRTATLWQRVGFIRHVPEYWLVAWLTLVRIEERGRGLDAGAAEKGGAWLSGRGWEDEDMGEVRGVIAGFRRGKVVDV
ncbi:hypothetical protein T440DRAFT_504721 [Plenodomus tracheiphilus IPT5]|uniref:Zn(2)-C6 fungal-type domain-containing protein n=1 Tax=Plenodomus tracheiphilus IPT5 TaxID=1408161 RepID=A0A6A7BLD6_9PLEO|nr:hypothetical protein T440DRAFT_504721 [Plenodomus tracheiphilus IPT5]